MDETTDYTAVCQIPACGWEGPEDDVEFMGTDGDTCPRCGQDSILYFAPGSDEPLA